MAEGSIGYLFDENFSPRLVSILRLLGEQGLHTVVKVFGAGADDADWLPRAAEYGYIYVTSDRKQLTDERIAQVVRDVNGRAVFLSSRFATSRRWDQALWILKHWRQIKADTSELARGEARFVQWAGTVVIKLPGRPSVARSTKRASNPMPDYPQLTLLEDS
jgi:hypothetical protein